MHIETLPVQPDERAAIFNLAVLARRSRRVSIGDVTAYGRVQDFPRRERLGTKLILSLSDRDKIFTSD